MSNQSASSEHDENLIQFVRNLKDAIQSGSLTNDSELSASNPLKSLINVNNLSNQTFTYIVDWLRGQQPTSNPVDLKEQKMNNECKNNPESKLQSEFQSMQCKLKILEIENDKLNKLTKELQEENLTLKTKLITLEESHALNQNQTDLCTENERLKRLVDDLIKSNEEKDKKLDELAKQVIRFKRIQDIVLTAQTSVSSSIFKNKNLTELEFELNENANQIKQLTCESHTNQQLISSYSIVSSLSSSSSSSSVMNSNNFNTVNTNISAPLATIAELTNNSASYIEKFDKTSNKVLGEQVNSNSNNLQANSLQSPFKSEFAKSLTPKNSLKSPVRNEKTTNSKYASTSLINEQTLSLKSPDKTAKSNVSNLSQNKGFKGFFGKFMRASLMNISEPETKKNELIRKDDGKVKNDFIGSLGKPFFYSSKVNVNHFKRGGNRATAQARLQNTSNNTLSLNKSKISPQDAPNLDTLTFAKLPSEQVYEWLNQNGFEAYFPKNSNGKFVNSWIKNGLHLLQATQHDYEKELGIKNPLHRKKLFLLLQSMYNLCSSAPETNFIKYIDHVWVLKWLDDIGLPQYKENFSECMFDGRMLYHLSNEDFYSLNIQSELHFLSIKRAVHVLRLNNFDPQCLRRRPSGDDLLDKSEVMLWTNHRVMEWLRSIDLSEYAPNLRGSGVHGGLMIFESRFNATVLADILSIPISKTLLRRHLTTLFNDLIGEQVHQNKRTAESQPDYKPLSASNKLKSFKRGFGKSGIFSHKRTKSHDSHEFLYAPLVDIKQELLKSQNCSLNQHSSPTNEHRNYTDSNTYSLQVEKANPLINNKMVSEFKQVLI